ncbi:MAG: TRAP transporter small permease [Comamonas sp.]|nr:TRAP transporter small permease [Comamonas sp.]
MQPHADTRGESTALRILSRAVAFACNAAMALSALAILVSLALIGWAVVMRYFFNAAPVWVDEFVGHLLVATVMLAVAQTFRRGEHIGVDVLVERLPATGKRWAVGWAAITSGAVALVLIVSGWQTSMLARTLGLVTEGHLEWPTWWLMLLLPLGGAMLLLATIEVLWRTCANQPLRFAPASTAAAPKDAP